MEFKANKINQNSTKKMTNNRKENYTHFIFLQTHFGEVRMYAGKRFWNCTWSGDIYHQLNEKYITIILQFENR